MRHQRVAALCLIWSAILVLLHLVVDDFVPFVHGMDEEHIVRLVAEGLTLDSLDLFPPGLDHAELAQQSVLDEGVQHDEPVVLVHEHVIDVVGLLLSRVDVLRTVRLKAHHRVSATEDVHEGRHDALNHLHDVGAGGR